MVHIRDLLELVEVILHKYLLCSIEETFLVEVLSRQAGQHKARIFTIRGIHEDLSREVLCLHHECGIELFLVTLYKHVLVLKSSSI